MRFIRNEEGIPVCPECGTTDFDQVIRDQDSEIKKQICEFAGIRSTGGCSYPECRVPATTPCPRPGICTEAAAGCLRTSAYVPECGKMPGKRCPKDICPVRLMKWQVERNKIKNFVKASA